MSVAFVLLLMRGELKCIASEIKPYYFNQLPLIKSHMNAKSQSQDVREHWKFKEDEEVPKKEQIQAKGLQNAP